MWLLRHDILLTNYQKSLKGLSEADCKLCESVCENTLHQKARQFGAIEFPIKNVEIL